MKTPVIQAIWGAALGLIYMALTAFAFSQAVEITFN
jgi:hypothetical protein